MLELFVMAACIGINAFLTCIEMAFVSVSKPELRRLSRDGNREATRILSLRANPERTLSVIQIGLTLLGALAAAIGGAGVDTSLTPTLEQSMHVSHMTAEVLALLFLVIPYTFITVVFGELIPKTMALKYPTWIILRTGRWLSLADRSISPIVNFMEWITKRLIEVSTRGFLGGLLRSQRSSYSSEGQHEPLEVSHLSQQHRQYMLNLLALETRRVREAILPWDQVICVSIGQNVQQVESVVLTSGHTRLPVLAGTAIVGILHSKEFIALHASGNESWSQIVRPAISLAEGDFLLRAVRIMQEKRSHLAIVRTPAGRLAGIVTLEDIIEEIIGDIYDEDDDGTVRRILRTGSGIRSLRVPELQSGPKVGAPPPFLDQ